MSEVVDALIKKLGKNAVLTHEEASTRSAGQWKNPGNLNCLALLLPSSTEEVSQMMQICYAYNQPVVPQGGLTSVAEAAHAKPTEIAISLERMNKIEEINTTNKIAIVEAGVVLLDLQQKAEENDLLFALNLGAKGSCMIGGNIATNAGGLEAVRYGVMRNLVLGLEVVLADGTIISSMNKMIKNNAGYDLKQLFIGSEGTLGIITRAVVKLEDLPKTTNTAYIAVDSFDKAAALLQEAKKHLNNHLTSYELLWHNYYTLMTSTPSPFAPPLPQTYPYYILMEVRGQDAEKDATDFENFLADNMEKGLIADAAPAQTHNDYEWFWGIRENVELIFSVHQPVFLFDVSLPISDMEAYISTIQADIKKEWPVSYFYTFGHMADGNLHLYVSCGENNAETQSRLYDIVFAPLKPIGGSVTAEHGIGLEKKKWLSISRTQAEIELMKTVKRALDPKNIMNPGKVFSL